MAPGFDGGLEKYQVEPRSDQLLKHGGFPWRLPQQLDDLEWKILFKYIFK
jgi:hypothetical protein